MILIPHMRAFVTSFNPNVACLVEYVSRTGLLSQMRGSVTDGVINTWRRVGRAGATLRSGLAQTATGLWVVPRCSMTSCELAMPSRGVIS
jgi:hypothetical protein